ncbi:MAG: sigma-54 dependent transcriptional regulator [Pseudomonadota bacterium]
MTEQILIIEDDEIIRETLAEVLEKQYYAVHQAADGASAFTLIKKHNYDLILLDLKLPDMHGLDVMQKMRDFDGRALVVVMTAYPEVRTAVSALKAGAYDYINKPFELDEMKELIRRALETQHLRTEVERLRICAAQPAPIEGMIGSSPAFLDMLEIVRKVAVAGKVPVLVRGESGTGKERVAQSIHNLSRRSSAPWVTLNCSAISEGLLESEMFGHEKGAFTDAKTSKRGLLELADGGTLFLDEIGDLALSLQPKLLRAIETQTFRRVGGQQEVCVDVRFVAATHRDLEAMVKTGAFRHDLYYRLNVASIDVPSLRERGADILPLARHFMEQAAAVMGIHKAQLDPAVNKLLEAYAWPGNVRELRNVMERALILSSGALVVPAYLPKEILAQIELSPSKNLSLAEMEKNHILRVLKANNGNKSQAAKQLGITRPTLRSKIKQYALEF